jgi:hypothetical protein
MISPGLIATKGHSSDLPISFIAGSLVSDINSNRRIDIGGPLLPRATVATDTR